MQDIIRDLYFAFVCPIGAFRQHGFRKFVHDITRRKRDIEEIVLASSFHKFDRIFTRLATQQI